MEAAENIELINAPEHEKANGKADKIAEALTNTDLVILDELGYLWLPLQGSSKNTQKKR